MCNRGYIQVYTGNGKGKTTAAFGLAIRALCAGKSVYIAQFVKSMKYNETKIESLFPLLKIEQLGRGCFIDKTPAAIDIELAHTALEKSKKALTSGEYDVVILDEVTIAIYFNLLSTEQVIEVTKSKLPNVEVIMTGRYAPKEIIEMADLVTEMKEIKHYYNQGVLSREGIDK